MGRDEERKENKVSKMYGVKNIRFIIPVAFIISILLFFPGNGRGRVLVQETFETVPEIASKGVTKGRDGSGWTQNESGWEVQAPVYLDYAVSFGNAKRGAISFDIQRKPGEVSKERSVFMLQDGKGEKILLVQVTWSSYFDPSRPMFYLMGPPYFKSGVGLWGPRILLDREVKPGQWIHVDFIWDDENGRNDLFIDGRKQDVQPKRYDASSGEIFPDSRVEENEKKKKKGKKLDYPIRPFGDLLSRVKNIRLGVNYHKAKQTGTSPLTNAVLDNFVVLADEFPPAFRPEIISVNDDTFGVPGISGKLTTGDTVRVTLESEKGGNATFDMGKVKGIPMTETETAGIYEGSYTINAGDDYEDGKIVGRFTSAGGVSATPLSSDNVWTIDTSTNLVLEVDKKDLPADENAKSKIKVTVTDINGEPVEDHHIRIDLTTTEEYTGVVGAGYFIENIGAEVEATWRSVTDAWGEVDFEYRSGFAAKTAIVTAKDLTTGSVGVDHITSYIDAMIDIALTRPVSKAAARRGLLYYMTVEASREELTADGRSRSVIRAHVYDPNGTPVKGDEIEFTLDQENGTIKTIKAITDENGRATAEYRAGKKIGIVQITAYDKTRGLSGFVSITLLSDAPAKIYLAARPDSLPADGFSKAEIEVKVTDINDNPNEDTEVLFNLEKGEGDLKEEKMLTDRYGETKNSFTSGREPGIATIKATVKSKVPTEEEMNTAKNVLFVLYSDLDDEMRLTKWLVRKGDEVKEGDPVCEYEIRGEQYTFTAPYDLKIKEILAETWDDLEVGQTLALATPVVLPD